MNICNTCGDSLTVISVDPFGYDVLGCELCETDIMESTEDEMSIYF